MGRSLGRGMREFKNSVTKDDHQPAELTTAPAVEEPVRASVSTSKREHDSI
jgi:Sec-independent protein translocase protein TatA